MVKMTKVVIVPILVFVLTGCAAPLIAPLTTTIAPHVAGAAVDISKGKYKDIEMVMGKGFEKDTLKKFDNVAFLVRASSQDYFSPGAGTLFSDNLSKEFMKMGFQVVDRDSLEDTISELEFQRGKFSSNKNLSKVGKMVGIAGIFKGSVQSGQDFSTGFMGIGAGIKQGIIGASLKLIDVETTKVVLMLTATYKKPKDASEVAKNMAEAFKLYSESESDSAKPTKKSALP